MTINKFFANDDDITTDNISKNQQAAAAIHSMPNFQSVKPRPSFTTGQPKKAPNYNVLAKHAIAKLNAIEAEMNNVLIERELQIKDMIRAVASGKHILFLGPPGTGKSYMAREFYKHIDSANYFEWLLNRTSDPSEILGPYSIKAMERDSFSRVYKGKLPDAHVAFLDEIYKCNEPTLNVMLPLLNEGIFFNDGQPLQTNIRLVVAASNEEPQEDGLEALHDRLLFRHWVDYIQDNQNRIQMMKQSVDYRSTSSSTQLTKITIEEIDALRFYVNEIEIPDNIYKTMDKVVKELSKKSIKISDRRLNACIHIMQANAALNNRPKVTLDDLVAIVYVLSEKKDDVNDINNIVINYINPYDLEIKNLFDKAFDIYNETVNADSTEMISKAVDAKTSFDKIIVKFNKIIKDATDNGKDVSIYENKKNEIIKFNQRILNASLGIDSNLSNTQPVDTPENN